MHLTWSIIGCSFFAVLAYAGEFNMVSQYFIAAGVRGKIVNVISDRNVDIVNAITLGTAYVVMWAGGGIEAFLGAANLDLQYGSPVGHQFQVSVHCAKSYAW